MTDSASIPRPALTARERARRSMLDQIAAIAVELFDEHGFDSTTIDDICTAAGISRTTFFRYFQSKEDVLAREFADLGDDLLALVHARPENETAWAALRAALLSLASRYADAPQASVRAVRLVIDSPTLTTFHQDKLARWGRQLEPELRRRLPPLTPAAPDPRPQALTIAALGCLDAALTAWVITGTATALTEILASALSPFD
jgi:AcrR family transcriptional regulator